MGRLLELLLENMEAAVSKVQEQVRGTGGVAGAVLQSGSSHWLAAAAAAPFGSIISCLHQRRALTMDVELPKNIM